MTPEQFCYWLQGFFEIAKPSALSPKEVEIIRNHLDLVFKHVLDDLTDGGKPDIKKALAKIHNSGTKFRC